MSFVNRSQFHLHDERQRIEDTIRLRTGTIISRVLMFTNQLRVLFTEESKWGSLRVFFSDFDELQTEEMKDFSADLTTSCFSVFFLFLFFEVCSVSVWKSAICWVCFHKNDVNRCVHHFIPCSIRPIQTSFPILASTRVYWTTCVMFSNCSEEAFLQTSSTNLRNEWVRDEYMPRIAQT